MELLAILQEYPTWFDPRAAERIFRFFVFFTGSREVRRKTIRGKELAGFQPACPGERREPVKLTVIIIHYRYTITI